MSYISIADYAADGQTRRFAVPFPYLDRGHVHVFVQGVDSLFEWDADSTVRIPVTPTEGERVRIRRITPQEPLVTFYDTSTLRAEDQNTAALQPVYLLQEQTDALKAGLLGSGDGSSPLDDIFAEGLAGDSVLGELVSRIAASDLYAEIQDSIDQTQDALEAALQNALSLSQTNEFRYEDWRRHNEEIRKARRETSQLRDDLLANLEQRAEQLRADFDAADADIANQIDSVLKNVEAAQAQIVSEQTKRADEDAALARQQDTLAASIDDAVAGVASEKEARVSADEAAARRIDGVQARLADAEASVVDERTARTTKDEAFASDIEGVRSRLGDNEAAVLTESQTRADEDSALSDRVSLVESNVGDNKASIQEEQTARTTQDEALAADVDALSSELNTAKATLDEVSATRAREDEALSTRLTNFGAELDGNKAALTEEQTARADEDSALSDRLDKLSADSADNSARITEEATASADRDSALSRQYDELKASSEDNSARITEEANASASRDQAAADRLDTVELEVDENSAAIVDERNARTTQEKSTASRLSGIEADVGDNKANFTSLQKTTSDADSALSKDIEGLRSRTATAEADITSEREARTSANSALSKRLDQMGAEVDGNGAAISEEATTRANENDALGKRVDSVVGKAGDNTAAIQTEQTARADADSALGKRVDTVQSTVGDNTASINQVFETVDGIGARYGVAVDAGGRFGGFVLNNQPVNGQNVIDFDIEADRLRVFQPGTDTVQLGWVNGEFKVDGNVVATGSLTADKINIENLSTLSANLGTVTGGKFQTSDNEDDWRIIIDGDSQFPFWYGHGPVSRDNAVILMDTAGGATFRGQIQATSGSFRGTVYATDGVFQGEIRAASGTFAGKLTAGAIDAVNTGNIVGGAITEYASAARGGQSAPGYYGDYLQVSIGVSSPDDSMLAEIAVEYDYSASRGTTYGRVLKNGEVFRDLPSVRASSYQDARGRTIFSTEYSRGTAYLYDTPGVNNTYTFQVREDGDGDVGDTYISAKVFKR